MWSEYYVTELRCSDLLMTSCGVSLLLCCSGAGQVLADNVLLLCGVETLSICDINPMPVLQVLSRNAKHSVSSMGISLEHKPDLVRCVSMGLCNT